ncbi:MAG TPA: hypothetical protein VHG69_06385 [Thermoleophilaceae bacterium]|nr:hypothetical protein [Thermoleophilaceae bacterium]
MIAYTNLTREDDRLSGSLDTGTTTHPFFFSASEPISPEIDSLYPFGLLHAMKLGGPLRLPGPVSPLLLSRAAQLQDILHVWDRSFTKTSVEADSREPASGGGTDVACFFSGGVDSFYTVLKNRDEITDLIFCSGLDLQVDGSPSLAREVTSMVEEVAAALGKRLVRVETNIRSFSDRYVGWGLFHGSVLATIGLLFQHRFRKVLIPATHTYADLFPWGSHPLVDPLWSTETTSFVHEGCEATRVEKVRFISASEVAMDWLRVCWENRDAAYNCGECEKCLRTMINLQVVGALERCRTLPGTVDLRRVSRISVEDENTRAFVQENLEAVERLDGDPALAAALAAALKGGRRSDPHRWMRSLRTNVGDPLRAQLRERAPATTARLKRLRDRRRSA